MVRVFSIVSIFLLIISTLAQAAGGLTPGTATTLTFNGGFAKDVSQTWSTSGSIDKAVCAGTGTRDAWYSFVATSTTHYFILYSGFDGVLAVYTSDLVTNKLCLDVGGAGASEYGSASSLTVGHTYYVQIMPFSGTGSTSDLYSVGITEAASCFIGWFSTSWNTSGNWANNTVPTSASNVVIPGAPVNQPNISAGTIASTLNLTINSGGTLTVAATTGSGGYLDIYGNLTNNGTINHTGDAYIYLNGSGKTVGGSGTFTTFGMYLYSGSNYTLSSNLTVYDFSTGTSSNSVINLSTYTLVITTAALMEGYINFNSGTLEARCIINNPDPAKWNCGTGTFYENLSSGSPNWGVAGFNWYNFKLNYSGGTYSISCTWNVSGYFQISAGTFNASGYNVNIGGDFINNGTYTSGTGTTTFNGSSAQTCSGSSTTTINFLTINNTSSTGVSLNSKFIIAGTSSTGLILTDGILYTTTVSSVPTLTLNNDVIYSGGSSTVYVDGPMKKIGNDAFIFPVGDGGRYRRLAISAPSTTTTEYTCQYFYDGTNIISNVHSFPQSIALPLTDLAQKEYWQLDQGGTSPGNVTIKLYWEDATASSINNCTDLTIAHYTGSTWIEEPATATGTCSGTGSGTIITNAVVTSYSPFTFASKSKSTNSLPLKWLEFEAQKSKTISLLNWETLNEINVKEIVVERASANLNFAPIGVVKAGGTTVGNSHYNFKDLSPLAGKNYYRLKEVDFDGRSEYSVIREVEFNQEGLPNSLSLNVSPNPINYGNGFTLYYTCTENTSTFIQIHNLSGQLVRSKNLPDAGRMGVLNWSESEEQVLEPGIYLITLVSGQNKITRKLVVQ